jgi:hypothetical protein
MLWDQKRKVIQNKKQQNYTAVSFNNTTLLNSRRREFRFDMLPCYQPHDAFSLMDAVFRRVRKIAESDY